MLMCLLYIVYCSKAGHKKATDEIQELQVFKINNTIGYRKARRGVRGWNLFLEAIIRSCRVAEALRERF